MSAVEGRLLLSDSVAKLPISPAHIVTHDSAVIIGRVFCLKNALLITGNYPNERLVCCWYIEVDNTCYWCVVVGLSSDRLAVCFI